MSFTVYRSSAGSGKTFTLVKEYIGLIIKEPANFRHILAITFTNKAANEMKERVLTALRELAAGEQSTSSMVRKTLLPMLIRETGLSAAEIAANAGSVMEMILHNYADFSIGTIDSFSHKLIRTFAHDFGLPVSFNVELDSAELLTTAVDLLLDRAGDDDALTALLVQFLYNRMEEDKGWDIGLLLVSFAALLHDEGSKERLELLKPLSLENFRDISGQLHQELNKFEKKIREIATKATILMDRHAVTAADFYHGTSGIGRYFENLAAGKLDRTEPNSFVVKTINEDKWTSSKADPAVCKSIEDVKPAFLEIYNNIQEESTRHKPDYQVRKLLVSTIYPLAVLNEIGKILDDFKRQNNLVHISEFNTRIAGIVMNEPVPFIYERLGEKYRHILIDEFQDTSALQWLNFVPLIENALAGGWFNLVVGDGKQAIYRWRNGDVEQFNALPRLAGATGNEILLQRQKALERNYQGITLGSNYRSKPAIVDFNNRFFRAIAGEVLSADIGQIYDGLEQQYSTDKSGGFISIEFLRAGDEGPGYREKTLERVLEIIRAASDQQFNLSDIAVLCRNNIYASEIARYLLLSGIGVVSADSLLLHNSSRVRFLIACLNFLFKPKNDIVVAEIRQFMQNTGYHRDAVEELIQGDFAALPVYDLCESLIRTFLPSDGADTYTRFFLDEVLGYSIKTSSSATDFLEWWEKNKGKKSIVVPEELNAVRVMTIHKAKGLEFPLVILPFAHDPLKNTKEYLWVGLEGHVAPGLDTAILRNELAMETTIYGDLYRQERQKSMLDLLNLLYVAMTRPAEQLHILTRVPPKDKESLTSLPSFFRFFLEQENLWTDDNYHYTFGQQEIHLAGSKKPGRETILAGQPTGRDWRQKIEIRQRAPQRWDMEDPGSRSRWGKRIHTVLSWVVTQEDVAHALEKALLTGLADPGEVAEIEKIIESVVSEPSLARLFSKEVRVKTEAEILLPEGSFYRPDRVIFDEDAVTLLDYKTGKYNPAHHAQLQRYAGYLSGMGYRNVQRKLVYLGAGVEVVEV